MTGTEILRKPRETGLLRVQENGRYLANGERPFFWLGDTAWLLFQNLTLEETELYLKNRRDKGFTVIQATVIHTLPKADSGDSSLPLNKNQLSCALQNNDFARPDKEGEFWRHADAVLNKAEELGLYMGLLPAWGSMVKQNILTVDNAAVYADFLAERWGRRKNIIWILGGDIRGDTGGEVWNILGNAFKRLAPDQLITYHPFGRTSSSFWFADSPWLDFNMFQSGHRRYDQRSLKEWDDNTAKEGWFGEDNWRYVERDYAAGIKRPTLDGEPSYEQIPQGLHDPSQPYWQDYDVRRYAYWAVLAGACGHTYGHNAIMQFYKRQYGSGSYGVKSEWKDALHDPGSGQMGHLASLMNSVDFSRGRAAGELVRNNGEGYKRVSAFMGEDFILVYTYSGENFTLDLDKSKWKRAEGLWFDPAAGIYSYCGIFNCEKSFTFSPPEKKTGHKDWVLLLRRG
jgi:hypothetical protein